jgi:FtsH-binding integral membrane protein
VFIGLIAYETHVTKQDLSKLGSLCVMALFGIILASVVNIFLKSSALEWVMTFVGIAVFIGLIAYETQALKALYQSGMAEGEDGKKLALRGAFALYLSFINLFLLLLRIFGRQRN